jgi:hypothetical protein
MPTPGACEHRHKQLAESSSEAKLLSQLAPDAVYDMHWQMSCHLIHCDHNQHFPMSIMFASSFLAHQRIFVRVAHTTSPQFFFPMIPIGFGRFHSIVVASYLLAAIRSPFAHSLISPSQFAWKSKQVGLTMQQANDASIQRTALVTGATDGIGLHTATKLAMAGYAVYVHGRCVAETMNRSILYVSESETYTMSGVQREFRVLCKKSGKPSSTFRGD